MPVFKSYNFGYKSMLKFCLCYDNIMKSVLLKTFKIKDNQIKRHFDPISEIDLQNNITLQIPKNTLNHAKWAVNTFNDWLKERNTNILNSNSSDLMFLSEDDHATINNLTINSLNMALKYVLEK